MALSMDDVDDEIDDDQLSDADDDFTSVSLDYLPSKLSTHLMPFQQDGIKFGIKRHGR
jgi:hypothetical protein